MRNAVSNEYLFRYKMDNNTGIYIKERMFIFHTLKMCSLRLDEIFVKQLQTFQLQTLE